jgi:hypothetical protein
MAIVIGPLHSSEARGAVGGLVYNSYRGRAYVKANVAPKTQYSEDQVNTRAIMSPVIALWQAISDAQRTDWAIFANLHLWPSWTGSDTRLSGWNWFAKVNFRLQKMNLTLRQNPPDVIDSVFLNDISVTDSPGVSEITWTPSPPAPKINWSVWCWLSPPHSAAKHPSIKLCKLYSISAFLDNFADIYTPLPGYHTVWIVPVSDQGITMPAIPVRIHPT